MGVRSRFPPHSRRSVTPVNTDPLPPASAPSGSGSRNMRGVKVLLLIGVLVAPAVLSGCLSSAQGTKDWWGSRGNIEVRIGALPAGDNGQFIGDFSSFRIGIKSVAVVPVGEAKPTAGVLYQPELLGIDLAQRFEEQKSNVVLRKDSIPMKTIERVDVQLVFVDATLKTGKTVPFCPQDKPSEVKPCVAIAKGGNYVLNKKHDPPKMQRGKTMIMEFPFAVGYSQATNEYFLQARFIDEEAPVTFT